MVVRIDPHKVAYMAVPKAACSSVKAALAAIDPAQEERDAAAFGQKEVHGIYPTQRFRLHRWARAQGYFRFTVVREPVKRLLAVYTNRVQGLNELRNCRNIKENRVALPADPDADFFFQNLRSYTSASSVIKHHALPTIVFTGHDLARYSKVYRTSDLHDLSNDLSAHVGQQVDIPHFNSSQSPLTLGDLTPETHQALKAFLADEYEHLAAVFPNPFERKSFAVAA